MPGYKFEEVNSSSELVDNPTKKGCNRKVIITVVVVVVIVGALAIGLGVGLSQRSGDDATTTTSTATPTTVLPPLPDVLKRRIDCFPEAEGGVQELNEAVCKARGCSYEPTRYPRVPACFIPIDQGYGYKSIDKVQNTPLGFKILLQRTGRGIFGGDIENVTFEVEMRDSHLLRFKFDDADSDQRYKVPLKLTMRNTRSRTPKYEVDIYNTETFSFRIKRRSTGAILWDTGVGGLTFADQFLQVATRLPSENVYGFGEHVHQTFRHDMNFKTWPLFARDQPLGMNDNNLYGVHPFYECVEEDGNSHGVLLLNSNSMEVAFTPLPMLTYRTIGGILDFYMFLGPTPEMVIQQYTQAIGRPYMPPYWSLGYHNCRYGYQNLSRLQESLERTIKYDIPVDVQHIDIDHFDRRRDFTIDDINFPGLKDYLDGIKTQGVKTIILLDPHIEINDTYTPFLLGQELDAYLKWPNRTVMPPEDYKEYNNTNMMGYVWPEWKVVFLDYFLNRAGDLWADMIANHSALVPFDAIWMDMNEPANFGTNEDKAWNWPDDRKPYWTLKCPKNKWDDPPYRTKAAFQHDDKEKKKKERLSSKTLCMIGIQGDGKYRHYDVHSLYGWSQAPSTLRGVRKAQGGNKRSLVLTRSTYPGSGQWAGHWLGDNSASWDDLRLSIIGSLEFNLFGVPYIGADICGYFNSPSPELCKRWLQLGAFYPFSRTHNHDATPPQDPGYFGDEVAIPARDALTIRYRLLPYLYTLFHRAHTRGSTVFRPLVHEFPQDNNTWAIDQQFLWGSALLISPILKQGQEVLTAYIPKGRWYDYYTGTNVTETGKTYKGVNINDQSPVQLHIRGGYILPTQRPSNNTHFSRKNPFGLKVALSDLDGRAEGELFWDDGDSIDTYEKKQHFFAVFSCEKSKLHMRIGNNNVSDMSGLVMDEVEIMGVQRAKYIYVNDQLHGNFTFNSGKKFLNIAGLQLAMDKPFVIEWSETRRPEGEELNRLNCCPAGCNKTECVDMGCLWAESNGTYGVPWCYLPPEHAYYGDGSSGAITSLHWRNVTNIHPDTIYEAAMFKDETHTHVFHAKFYDARNSRYEVPMNLDLGSESLKPDYGTKVKFAPSFHLTVTRKANNKNALDTSIGGLTMADKFLQLTSRLPSKHVYGIGEQEHSTYLHDFGYKTWPLFARDQPPSQAANLYGSHPFYLCVEDDEGRSHGVLLLNSNAMEITLQSTPAITFRTTGGVLDFYIFFGDSPEQVVQRYLQAIGRPYFPPYWSLGFQLSRYGYNNLANMIAAVNRTVQARIPFDIQYADIDHMDERKDFTLDRKNFGGLPDYANELRNLGMKFIIILDPFIITNETNYTPYDLGIEKDVFIKWPAGENPQTNVSKDDNLLGWCWPKGRIHFVDFMKPNASDYWQELIIKHYNNVIKFDGLWIDMNEPANFGTNEDRPWNWPEKDKPYWSLKCPVGEWDDPPYKPTSIWGDRLSEKTICMTAVQNDSQYRHYDVHNLYGASQIPSSLAAMRNATGKRSIVISRSTFVGSGKEAGKWTGDNSAYWPHLKHSIVAMMEFNLFGIPYIGADVCGYFQDTTPEMCQRWHQLGAFYPFYRNHNGLNYIDQDPAIFGPAVADSTRIITEIRYSLLPYLYTLFYHAHVSGRTVVRPMLHEYPKDLHAREVDDQFLWGAAILISPVLQEDKRHVYAYFPKDRWFDYYTGEELSTVGQINLLDAPLDHIPIHIRGGYIIPTQEPANTTYFSRMQPFGLIVAPDDKQEAVGDIFWDDGDSIGTIEKNDFYEATFKYASQNVTVVVNKDNDSMNGLYMGTVRMFGVGTRPTIVNSSLGNISTFIYDDIVKELYIYNLTISMRSGFWISWS